MGRTTEISNSCVYDALEQILKMFNDGKSNEEIKVYIINKMDKCSEEM